VPSSISSSDAPPLCRVAPSGLRAGPLLAAALAALLFAAGLEMCLAARGYVPAPADSVALWVRERARAAALGDRALVLIGGSRIQLAADLDVLRRETGLEPVQLAIDGSSFVPVLEDLAADPAVRGTIVVDFSEHLLLGRDARDPALAAVGAWRAHGAAPVWTFAGSEERLTRALRSRLRSHADGASPWFSLRNRVLRDEPIRQYLVMLPDRSRYADYTRVPMPEFYLGRVARTLGERVRVAPGTTVAELQAHLRRRVEAAAPLLEGVPRFLDGVRHLAGLATRIRVRGGRIVFVKLPTSGLITALEERRFPRDRFWDQLARHVGAPALHYADDPALRGFTCPDGSHLDMRDRTRFTTALAAALDLRAAR
jgi:hypothetical protein